MSYSIIFKTKVVTLSDGRLLLLQRSGCNNDDVGREKDIFNIVRLYTEEEFDKEVEKFKKSESGESFDLKIGNRYCSWNDYASHLERMRKKAESFQTVKENARIFKAKVFRGVDRYENEDGETKIKHYSNEEWNALPYKERYFSGVSFSVDIVSCYEEGEIIKAIEEKMPIEVEYKPLKK